MFELKITLGNDAMQTPDDVAGALRKVAATLEESGSITLPDRGGIRDLNGNTIGTWRYEPKVQP